MGESDEGKAVLRIGAAARRLLDLVPDGGLVYAHSGTQSYVFVNVSGSLVTGNVQFPIADLNEILELAIPQTGGVHEVAQDLERIQRYTNDHVAVRNGSHDWTFEFRGLRLLEHQRGSYLILDFAIADAPDPLPSEVRLTYDGIIEAMPDREALVIVETDSRWERYRRSVDRSIPYRAGSTSHVVSLRQISRRTGAAAVARHHWRRARRLTGRTARQLGLRRGRE